jgi:predicted PurR-regulated permease PerM
MKKIFSTYIVVAFTILLMVLVLVISVAFNNSTNKIIENRVNEELDDIVLTATTTIDRNKLILESFASNSFVINGLLHRERYFTTTINYLGNASFLDEKYSMTLLNFKGDVVFIIFS